MADSRGLVKRLYRAMHPFILLGANDQSWPVDTDRASEIAGRLWKIPNGRELGERIFHAVAIRSMANPDTSEIPALLQAISEWIDEAGEEAVGEQVLNLQAALRTELGQYGN